MDKCKTIKNVRAWDRILHSMLTLCSCFDLVDTAKMILSFNRPGITFSFNGSAAFRKACEFGSIGMFDLALKYEYDIHANDNFAYRKAFINGHLDIVKRLIDISPELVSVCNDWICDKLYYHIRRRIDTPIYMFDWLLSECQIRGERGETCDRFVEIYKSGYLLSLYHDPRFSRELQLILDLEKKYGPCDVHYDDDILFKIVCERTCHEFMDNGKHIIHDEIWRENNLKPVKFLLALEETHGKFDIHADDDEIIRNAFNIGTIEFVKLLLSLEETHGNFDIHANDDEILFKLCSCGPIDYMMLVCSLQDTHGMFPEDLFGLSFIECCIHTNFECMKFIYSTYYQFITNEDIMKGFKNIYDFYVRCTPIKPAENKYITTHIDFTEIFEFFKDIDPEKYLV